MMERRVCLRELKDILKMGENYKFLWKKNPNLEIRFYFSVPNGNESARISLVMKNKTLGFQILGSYFNPFIGDKSSLDVKRLFNTASNLLESKTLEEGNLICDFVKNLVPYLEAYRGELPKRYLSR
jgi:hypothetical protein